MLIWRSFGRVEGEAGTADRDVNVLDLKRDPGRCTVGSCRS